jgi:hypothetical protein
MAIAEALDLQSVRRRHARLHVQAFHVPFSAMRVDQLEGHPSQPALKKTAWGSESLGWPRIQLSTWSRALSRFRRTRAACVLATAYVATPERFVGGTQDAARAAWTNKREEAAHPIRPPTASSDFAGAASRCWFHRPTEGTAMFARALALLAALAAIAAVAVPAASATPPAPSYSLSQCVLTPVGDHEIATTTAAWANNQKVSEIDVTYTYDVLSPTGPIVYKTVEASDLHGRNGSVTFNLETAPGYTGDVNIDATILDKYGNVIATANELTGFLFTGC